MQILNFVLKLKGENASGFAVNRDQILDLTIRKPREFCGETMLYEEVMLMANGNDHKANAFLHPEVRDLVWVIINGYYCVDFAISKGTIRCTQQIEKFRDLKEVDEVIRQLTRLAELVCRTGNPLELLEENFFAESSGTSYIMKIGFLESMASLGRKFQPDDRIIKSALSSECADLMLLAAQLLKKKGHKYLPGVLSAAGTKTTIKVLKYAAGNKITEILPYFEEHRKDIESEKIKAELIDYYIECSKLPDSGMDLKSVNEYIASEAAADNSSANYMVYCIKVLGTIGVYETILLLDSIKNISNARYIEQAIVRIQSRIGSGDGGWLSMQKPGTNEGDLSISVDKEKTD